MKKLELSETKYIKIDTIEKNIQIFEEICLPEFTEKAVSSAIVPLSLIKLLTELNKHVLLEGHVLFYDTKRQSTRQYYTLLESREFSNLVELKGHILFSEMLLDGYDQESGHL